MGLETRKSRSYIGGKLRNASLHSERTTFLLREGRRPERAKMMKDTPLAELTLRKYERPFNLERRELIKKICLSLGLLQPGDSRDVIVDVFQVILDAKTPMPAEDIIEEVIKNRARYKLPQNGVAGSNVRRQLRRLKELFLIEKSDNVYRVTENSTLLEIFEEKIEKFYLRTIVDRVKEYLAEVKKADPK